MNDNLRIKRENDRLYKKGEYPLMESMVYSSFELRKAERSEKYSLASHISRETTTACIIRNSGKKIVALNFANAMYPGGAYILGGNAQEEAPCRTSLLYYTIRTQHEFYSANRLHILPDYTDCMIYSTDVPVIRNDDGELLSSTAVCDFITAPAVNRRFAKLLMSNKKINSMERRIEKIVCLAASIDPEVIVFGAFGCGMFGNIKSVVLDIFERAVNEYTDGRAEVIFAIPD